MLCKSPVIVLGSVKYGESSVILKCYSQDFGLLSFIAGGVRGKKGGLKSSIMLPLHQMEAVFYNQSKSDLRRLKEVSSVQVYENMYYDPVKNCMCMFLAEVLSHLLQEEEPQIPLFNFLSQSFYALDEVEKGIANFHLWFLLELSGWLGFQPEPVQDSDYFDLMNGVYLKASPTHQYSIEGRILENWKKVTDLNLDSLESLKLSANQRAEVLDVIINYYRLHIKDFGQLKSIEVLHTVLH